MEMNLSFITYFKTENCNWMGRRGGSQSMFTGRLHLLILQVSGLAFQF